MAYGSTFENYILLEIDKGELKKSKEFDYEEYAKFKARKLCTNIQRILHKNLSRLRRERTPLSCVPAFEKSSKRFHCFELFEGSKRSFRLPTQSCTQDACAPGEDDFGYSSKILVD